MYSAHTHTHFREFPANGFIVKYLTSAHTHTPAPRNPKKILCTTYFAGDTAISQVTSLNKSHSIGTTASTTDTTAATDPENTSPAAAAAAYRGGNVDWLSVLGQLLADAAARFPHLSEWHCVQRALRSVCLAIASNRSHSGDDDAKQQTNDYVRRQTVIISKTKSELFKTLSLSANNAAGHSDYEALQSFCASSPAAATRLKRIGQRAAAVAGEAAHPINIRAPANRSGDVVINLSDVVLTTLNASWVPADLRPQLAAVHRYLLADMEDQCLDGFRTNAVEKGAFLRQMMAFLIDNACTPKRIKAMMAVLIRYARDGQTLFKVEYNV